VLGPGELEHEVVTGVGAETRDQMELGDVEIEAHVLQLEHRPRGQTVATGLVAGILLLLDQGDLVPVPRQPIGRGRAGRAPTND
jgi:hypothetical protein